MFNRFDLPHFWGSGKAAAADGTHVPMYLNNLIAQYHARYRKKGGIAYHYVSDKYVALFSQFITCGVWEGVYILDILQHNLSTIQPTTIHADTHGQSMIIFALAYLLGIDLMPRIQGWQDLKLFKPSRKAVYKHIGDLFSTEDIDFDLIERHVLDMFQVVLSIQESRLLPSTILRKLGYRSRKNHLYQAFQELGKVIRTLFLLRYISDPELRRGILTTTNKVELYHEFWQWLRFGSEGIITHNAPEEHLKRIRYTDLVANALMVQTVADTTTILRQLMAEGYHITPQILATFNPYAREHIKRFGLYIVDFDVPPHALDLTGLGIPRPPIT
ncbi:MAG: Tn3 family transposase [Aggregatilineales bacterium]